MVVRDPEDQRLLAVEQPHPVLPRVERRPSLPSGHAPDRHGPTFTRALDGVRAFILDADGVLMYRSEPIAGSPEALVELRRRGIPYRVVTNFSSAHRSSLAAAFGKATGLEVDAAEIITAASAAAAYTARHHAGKPILVLAAPDARREWAGQDVVGLDEADARAEPVAAVVIGDAGDDLSYRNLDIAFRQLRNGAEFVAMHRNPWWMTPKGFTLDAGALVAGPRVRARAPGGDHRQALAGRVPAGARRAPRRGRRGAAALASVPPTSRWSATTRGPTSPPPVASACAVSWC